MSHKGKPIILSDFLSITGDINKALLMMRKTAETDDVVAASYKDQIAHYTQMMLRTEPKGEREPVISLMRMLGEQEFNVAQEIERVWKEELVEQKEFVDKEHRVREFVARKVNDFWEGQLQTWVGPGRAQKILEIQQGIHKGGPPPAAVKPEEEKPSEAESELEALENMKAALEEKISELKKKE